MADGKVRIGIIGCGVIGKGGHLRRYLANPHAQVVAVCDIIPERAEEAAKMAGGAVVYTDYHELLKRDDVQGVSICTPHPVHAAPAIAAVEEGRVRFEILRISEEGALSTETWRPRRARGPQTLP